jgi:hypothetical protein
MTSQELNNLCEEWYNWCITRRYFIPPGAKNILARMQPSKIRQPPNAVMDNLLSFFNMAVHALADMGDPDIECFVQYYWYRSKNIKKVAKDMGIHRDTFYERRSRFARRAYSMCMSLKKAHDEFALKPETEAIQD